MDTLTKMFSTIAGVVIATSISSYYIWQFILGVPFLQSVLAYATTATLVLAEIISITWYAAHVRHKFRMYQGQYNQLPPPHGPKQIH